MSDLNESPLQNVYLVLAYRKTSAHFYVVGIFTSYERALEEAGKEEMDRDGKYSCAVETYLLDENSSL